MFQKSKVLGPSFGSVVFLILARNVRLIKCVIRKVWRTHAEESWIDLVETQGQNRLSVRNTFSIDRNSVSR